jgi:hypothetical protein
LDILEAQRREPIESLATSFQKAPMMQIFDQESGRLCSTYENQILLIPERVSVGPSRRYCGWVSSTCYQQQPFSQLAIIVSPKRKIKNVKK